MSHGSTWTKKGSSDKAQSSQTIRMLIKTLQYLAEDSAGSGDKEAKFVKIASSILKNSFQPSQRHNMNEQVSSLLLQLGWKNSQISLKSADVIAMVLGSNRYLDQTKDAIPGLILLVRTISVAVGSHILGRDVDALVNFDSNNNNYNINLQATSAFVPDMKSEVKTSSKLIGAEEKETVTKQTIATPVITGGNYETNQIILPIISNKLPLIKLLSLLKDVCEEFSRSWYQSIPELSATTDDGNLSILLSFINMKAQESGNDVVQIGTQIGSYFGEAINRSFPEEQAVTQEIIEGADVGSIIRDIKARSLCTLSPTSSCGNKIGGPNRRICDLSMGIWVGALGKLTEKEYKFTGFYEAGKRDPYCLMEFAVN